MKQPPFPLRPSEQVITVSPGAKIHRFGLTMGRLWLTSERVVFYPIVPWAFWIIPLIGLVYYLLNKPQRRELALSEIASRDRTSFGRNRNVLVLGTGDLSPDLKVVVDNFDGFVAALSAQPALSQPAPSP